MFISMKLWQPSLLNRVTMNEKVSLNQSNFSLVQKANKSKKTVVNGVVITPEYTHKVFKLDSEKIKIVVRNRFKEVLEVVTKCNTFKLWNKTQLKDKIKKDYLVVLGEEDFLFFT